MKSIKKCRIVFALSVLCLVGMLAACAPQSPSSDPTEREGNAVNEAVSNDTTQIDWSMDSDCTTCHSEEASSTENTACPAAVHADQGLDCASCHNDEAILADVHANASSGDVPKKLGETEVSATTCEACHNPDELAATTADSTVLTDSNGTVVNPHALPENDDHATLQCADCHKMHSDRGIDRTAAAACSSCHHAGVYECYTCHE